MAKFSPAAEVDAASVTSGVFFAEGLWDCSKVYVYARKFH